MVVVTVSRLGTAADISLGRVLYVMGPGLGSGRHIMVLNQWGWQLVLSLQMVDPVVISQRGRRLDTVLAAGKVDSRLLKLGQCSGPLQLLLDLPPCGGVGILNAWHFRALVTAAYPGGIEVLLALVTGLYSSLKVWHLHLHPCVPLHHRQAPRQRDPRP